MWKSIIDFKPAGKSDFVRVKGVLIHINPEMLPIVYDLLYDEPEVYLYK
jgi:hypothetical protein